MGFLLLGSLLLFTWWCDASEPPHSKVTASSLVLNAFDVGFLTLCLNQYIYIYTYIGCKETDPR